MGHIYDRQSAGESEWWKSRMLSSPPFYRFLEIGSRNTKVLEISYNNPGSDFSESLKKKVDAIRVCVFLSESPIKLRLEWWKNKKRGKYSPKSRSPPPPRSPRPPRPPVKSQSNHPQRLYEPKWDYCRLKGLPTVARNRTPNGIWYLTRSINGHITPLSEPSSESRLSCSYNCS